MIKVSDYVVKFLEDRGVRDLFLISGGGMMHLLDSVGKSGSIKYYCNLNEQATSICADAYSQFTNDLAACMVTTGPGGTNAVTGVAASYLDSNPVLVISGQVKTTDLVGDRKVRQIGPQEVNIVEIVKPITKYAAVVMSKDDIRYHLEKAVHLATHGRRGPVWVDIPLDVQGAQVDEASLRGYDPSEDSAPVASMAEDARAVLDLLSAAKRPVILVGHGVIAAKAADRMRDLAERLGVPVLATWRAKMLFEDGHPLYFGHPGSPGPRYSNFILQNSDFLLVLGSRLNVGITAFNERNFAPGAKKAIVDVDEHEIAKLDMDFERKVVGDAGAFVDTLLESAGAYRRPDMGPWLEYCSKMRSAYPMVREKQAAASDKTDMYRFADRLSDRTRGEDVIVAASSGRSCGILNLGFRRKKGQVMLGSMGLGSMGFALPASIGACVASGKRRTVCLEGDGSLQHNLQELALIGTYRLPIKLFVLNNGGYASIVVMQKNHFKGNFVACNEATGVGLTDAQKLAAFYGLGYDSIRSDAEIEAALDRVMSDDRPTLCEVFADDTFDEIPKAVSKVLEDGRIVSSKLEDLFPFLPEAETAAAMAISKR